MFCLHLFATASVYCAAPSPYISVTLDGEASKTVTSGPNYAYYAAKLTVSLSEAHTSDVTVDVTPSMISGSGVDPLGRYIEMSSLPVNGYLEKTKSVTFTAAEMSTGTLSKDLYVYVLGADDDTDGIGKGIKFAPAATGPAASHFNNENVTAILYIKKSTPQILYPTENYSYSGLAGGVISTFAIKISDDYNNMKSPFTVEWLKTGSGYPQTFMVTPNSDGEATVSIRYNAGEYTTRFRVKNAAGVWSDYRTISVQVNPAKQVSAVVETPYDSWVYNETDEELSVRFKLSDAYEYSTLYAFLVPQDAASSNLVVCKAFETGVTIESGATVSTGTAKIQLLDGTEETLPLIYSIVLRTAKTWDSGETIGTYESKDLEVYINNVAPTVAAVNMSGSAPVTVSGGKFYGKAYVGLNKIFTLEANDAKADLEASVTSKWTFSDPNGNAFTMNMTGLLPEIVLTNQFEVAGTYHCTVKLRDKDMRDREFVMLDPFEFKLIVSEKPTVLIKFPNTNTFNETDADKGQSYFDVELSAPASKPIEVALECTRVGEDGVLNLSTNSVVFSAGETRRQVHITELDGTAASVSFKGGFSVTAKVVTEESNEDGIPFKNVYLPATEKMYVANEAPMIILPVDTGATNIAATDVQIPLAWKIDDVDSDLTNGLSVVWTTSEGAMWVSTGDNVSEGVFTNVFNFGGAHRVTLTVTDKDGGVASTELNYLVEAVWRTSDGCFTYDRVDDGKVSIVKSADMKSTVEIPSIIKGCAVTSIGVRAFYGCSSLVNVVIPDSVTSIGASAFSGCTSIADVAIPQCVCLSTMGEIFPDGYQSVTNIVIADGVTRIGAECFKDCLSLKKIVIPASVSVIYDNAFQNCSALEEIVFLGDAPDVGNNILLGTPRSLKITVKEGSVGWRGGVSTELPEAWPVGDATARGISYYDESIDLAAMTPVITPADGSIFADTCEVSISCAMEGAKIYYRTDGKTPKFTDAYLYKGAFTISDTSKIVAVAVKEGVENGFATATLTKRVLTLAEAAGDADLTFTTGGAADWVPIGDLTAADGVSARSGAIGDEEESWMELSVQGSGTLTFNWKVFCEDDPVSATWDHLVVFVDGKEREDLCFDGEMGWENASIVFDSEGNHTVRWVYVKDESDSEGADCAWISSVNWAPTLSGDITVDIGDDKNVVVPVSWIDKYDSIVTAAGGDKAAALQRTAANGRKVWECFMLGVDPTKADDDFKITRFWMEGGKPKFEFSHSADGVGNSFAPKIKVKGKAELSDGWSDVPEGGNSAFRFFMVEVELP
ncbi:MAG: leucine-rich repeat protein [Kiritimatiellae bacterium]|nr:leucine-rich repeat protein [Kiritimatiellia bacterium]